MSDNSITESDLRAAATLVKTDESESFRDNLVRQVARIISKDMKEDRDKHRILSDQHDALIQKCNALARYARHADGCIAEAMKGVTEGCTCGLNDLLAGVTVKA